MSPWVKNPPAMQEMQETQVQSLGWEDSLEDSMANHSSILAWRIPWSEEPGGFFWGPWVAKCWTRLKRLSTSTIGYTLYILHTNIFYK